MLAVDRVLHAEVSALRCRQSPWMAKHGGQGISWPGLAANNQLAGESQDGVPDARRAVFWRELFRYGSSSRS